MNKQEKIIQFLDDNNYTLEDVLEALGVMSGAEASEAMGKHSGYMRQIYTKYPNRFKNGSIVKLGKTYLITKDGMDHLVKNS
ncbi:helix-turn-helix domain-containing protein [Listeria newyorkensis]|uniref:helix-turn-helix domain-containing protein n=1 Tax=Listeria newyorkensis TaxID=1497681 RepID=UPI0010FA12DE|nr:helix-turn-helix domain-containing protein [Listeria newyorkensis]